MSSSARCPSRCMARCDTRTRASSSASRSAAGPVRGRGRNREWFSSRSARARLPARGRSRAEGRGPHPAARAYLVPNRALSQQICRSGARTRLATVRNACERAAPKPPHPGLFRHHRRRPGVRSPLRWSHRPAPNRYRLPRAGGTPAHDGSRRIEACFSPRHTGPSPLGSAGDGGAHGTPTRRAKPAPTLTLPRLRGREWEGKFCRSSRATILFGSRNAGRISAKPNPRSRTRQSFFASSHSNRIWGVSANSPACLSRELSCLKR